jgi:hypothetical protein
LAKRLTVAILLIYFLVLVLDGLNVGIKEAINGISLGKLRNLIVLSIVPGVVVAIIPLIFVASVRICRVLKYCRRRQLSILRLAESDLNELRDLCK